MGVLILFLHLNFKQFFYTNFNDSSLYKIMFMSESHKNLKIEYGNNLNSA